MARHYSRLTIIGNLTNEPDFNKVSGSKVCNLDVAVNRSYQSNGEWQEETSYVNNISIWGEKASRINDAFQKGDRIFLAGPLKMDEWEQNGQDKSRLSMTARDYSVLDRDDDNSGGRNSGSSQSSNQSNSGNSGFDDDLLDDPAGNGSTQETEDDIPF